MMLASHSKRNSVTKAAQRAFVHLNSHKILPAKRVVDIIWGSESIGTVAPRPTSSSGYLTLQNQASNPNVTNKNSRVPGWLALSCFF